MRRVLAWTMLAAAPLLLARGAAALAQSAPDMAAQQAALQAARARVSEARDLADALRDRAVEANQDAERTAAERGALEAEVDEAEAELAAAEVRLSLIDARQKQRLSVLSGLQGPLIDLVAALQSHARRPAILAFTQPESIEDVVHLRAIMAGMQPGIDRRTERIRAEIARARLYRDQEAVANRALVRSRDTLTQRREELARLEASQRARVRAIGDEMEAERLRAYNLGERTRDLIETMDRGEADADLADRLAAMPVPVAREAKLLPKLASPVYRLPVDGRLVTGLGEASDSGFRARGLTLAAAEGARVVAPAAGRVAYAGRYRGFGNIVIIDHGAGWTSLLTGLGALDVRVGQNVAMGAPLGASGAAYEGVTVELRRSGRPVDIVALLS